MAVRRIITYGEPVLRQKTESISEVTDELRELVEDMIDTMYEADGIGLAAPQIGESIALCVVNMGLIRESEDEPKAYLNPVIVSSSENESSLEEGCLSIPDIREDVTRAESVAVKYQDLDGRRHEETCNGLLARVLQHEIDHLNGVLFIDRISPIRRKLLSKRLRKMASESRQEAL